MLPLHPEWKQAVLQIIEPHTVGLPQDENVVWISLSVTQIMRKLGSPSKLCVSEEKQNRIKPLEEYVGQSPGVRLPLWSYKSKLLTSKPKASHHLLAEGSHALQGDKQ